MFREEGVTVNVDYNSYVSALVTFLQPNLEEIAKEGTGGGGDFSPNRMRPHLNRHKIHYFVRSKYSRRLVSLSGDVCLLLDSKTKLAFLCSVQFNFVYPFKSA